MDKQVFMMYKLVKLLLIVLMIAHFFACIWVEVAFLYYDHY